MIKLGVNVDHIATIGMLREGHPDVLKAAKESINTGLTQLLYI